MNHVVYLVVDRYAVRRMNTKQVPQTKQGEHILKLEVEVKPEAFRDPLVTQKVTVDDWREGIDVSDVEFKNGFITKDEAEKIRKDRLEHTVELLRAQGFQITKPQGE